ncbi:MAG: hypothetical protein ABSB49_18155 [Polyangia bacterium]
MNRVQHVPLFYADDKDVFDILMSKSRRFDTRSLLALARRRGIYLSADEDREWIAGYLSRLIWSWPELQHLLELAVSPDRREKTTSIQLITEAVTSDVRRAVEAVKGNREERRGEAFVIRVDPGFPWVGGSVTWAGQRRGLIGRAGTWVCRDSLDRARKVD